MRTRPPPRHVACHEAAHAVLATVLGGRVTSVQICPSGLCEWEAQDEAPQRLALRDAIVSAAGPVALARALRRSLADVRHLDAQRSGPDGDGFAVAAAAHVVGVPEWALWLAARALVCRSWPAVERVAAELLRRPLDGAGLERLVPFLDRLEGRAWAPVERDGEARQRPRTRME